MKRLISLFMSIVMVLSIGANCSVTVLAECSHENQGIWYGSPYYEELDDAKHYKYEDCKTYCQDCGEVFNKWTEEEKKSHSFRDGECKYCGYEEEECEHRKTDDNRISRKYEQCSESQHICVEVFEVECRSCEEIIDEYTEKNKESHEFSNGKCEDCGYEKKECTHSNTSKKNKKYSYEEYNSEKHTYKESYDVVCSDCGETIEKYSNSSKESHNIKKGECTDCGYEIENCSHSSTKKEVSYWNFDEDYYEYDIICTVCGKKVGTEVSNNKTNNKEEPKCNHTSKTAKAKNIYYVKNSDSTHYMYTEYDIECADCKVFIESNTEKVEKQHNMSNNKCIDCGYEKKIQTEQVVQKPENKPNTTTNSTSKNESNQKVEQPKNNTTTQTTTTKKDSIESIYIDIKESKFVVDETVVEWKEKPILDANGNIQVPLRQLAEIMGWKVSWNATKRHAVVTDGKTTKTFMEGFDIYQIKDSSGNNYETLQNKVHIKNGTLYVDLDGVLASTGYSYYVHNNESYHIIPRNEAISKVATNTVLGNTSIVGSKTILEDLQYKLEVQQNEMLFMVIENDDGTRSFAAFVPAAQQALKGNYYEGEVTWQGIVGEIIVGELPGVGTAADLRDVSADFKNWEWSWAHAGQTALDIVGCIPLIGCLKYTDEVGTLLKKSGKVADADVTKMVQKFMDTSANYDELASATSKTLNDYVKATKKAIKNADDLKALAKNPDIYADNVLEHIFYGNKSGGFHYNGLSDANGKINEIVSTPNKYGVYRAKVTVLGKPKKLPNTFFPDTWTPQQVLDTINEAYYNGTHDIGKNIIDYTTKSGMEIQINLNDSGKIVSAFPKYQ